TTPLAPRSMVGHLAAVELPESWKERWEYVSSTGLAMPTVHPLQVMLAEKYRIETNVQTLGKRTLLRASMQHYVTEDDLDHLYDVLASFIDG
ncbi:MAG TPA: hypothetical protein QF646_02515, partial [Candidatus Poseidoniales archaeon]|nr:hypothetical protein [Candidatus Poseidoniales archaeon]